MLNWIRPPSAATTSRRSFLKVTSLAGAGFLIGCERKPSAPSMATPAPAKAIKAARDETLNAFIRIGVDNTVTVIVKHLDKGQGVTTGLPAIVAEELDARWSQMRAEFAPANTELYKNLSFGIQGTGGSSSVANSWQQLRTAAAAARQMLRSAAAQTWAVPVAQITITDGQLRHVPSDRSASFGDMAAAAAKVAPPADPVLKRPAEFKLLGTHLPRLDSHAKTNGSAQFTADIVRPGMLSAVIAHPPKFGARVLSVDDSAARAVPGVSEVVQIERGVAVLADSYFSATKGRAALRIEWDESAAETRSSSAMFAEYHEALARDGALARSDGDVDGAFAAAESTLRSSYELPFLAHATMEPLNCVVELTADRCEIWTGSQLQTLDQGVVAQITGLTPPQVIIHTQFAGGSFGRRAVPDSDYIAETVMIAKAIGGRAPVKLQWSRENDMRGGRYRPMSVHQLDAALDGDGKATAWRHRIAAQSFMQGTLFESSIQDGIDGSVVEGARGLPYAFANIQVQQTLMPNGVPTLWWRSVGHSQNGFVTESFVDEIAHAQGDDPVALRRQLLADQPRHLAVLERAAAEAGWGKELPAGRGRGVAVHESFGTVVAQVAEVTVGAKGEFKVDRIVCAVDCGIALTPDVIRAQMEGGIGYGLSAALREAITLRDGAVEQDNFHQYRPLRIAEMPVIEVHIIDSAEPPSGVGEPGTPPVAAAVTNALFAATGKRIRRLPIADQLKT